MQSLFLLSMMLAPLCQNDTITRVVRPDSVVVIEDNGSTRVQIYGKENDPAYVFNYAHSIPSNSEISISEHQTSAIDFTIPLLKNRALKNDSLMDKSGFYATGFDDVHIGASILTDKKGNVPTKVGINAGLQVIGANYVFRSRRDCIGIGLGLEVNIFRGGKQWQYVKRDGELEAVPYPENSRDHRSRLKSYALTLPIGYTHAFNKNFSLGLFVEPQYTLGNCTRTRYSIDYKHFTDKYYNIDGHRFNMAYRVVLESRKIGGLYIKYQPFNTFSSSSPTNFKLLTFGVTL